MKKLVYLAATVAGVAVVATAGAVTYGQPDGNGHPEVGALLAPHAFSDGTWVECSGTLIARTVFLTAAHCDMGLTRVEVTFASTFDRATSTTYWGTWHPNPDYNQAQNDPQDIAVVVLDKAPKGITPARLPAAGSLNSVDRSTRFTSVGYGSQLVTNGPGGRQLFYQDIRYVATGTLNSLTPGWLRISRTRPPATAGRATATPAGRTSSVPGRERRTSSPGRPSPGTPGAARRTWTTASTRRRRARSSGSTSRFRRAQTCTSRPPAGWAARRPV